MNTCQICKLRGSFPQFQVQEMMFGTREVFEYFQCSNCEALQIKNTPRDLSKYYPKDYYSFSVARGILQWIKQQRSRHLLGRKNFVGAIASYLWGEPDYVHWLKKAEINRHQEILDVGSGGGELLTKLGGVGFKTLMGVDPYLDSDIDLKGFKIKKAQLYEIQQVFDFIMMNHSFEHMPEPHVVFKELRRLLKPNGQLLLRVPVVSEAWRVYGVHWVQLDAPRHLFLHSEKSMKMLAEQHGFALKAVEHDSYAFQFWGSEQYKAGIALRGDKRSFAENPHASIFTRKQMTDFAEKAKILNKNHLGDQACFYFKLQ